MVVDSYGINNELARDITLRSVNIEFAGGRLFWTSSNNYKLTVDHCLIDGEAQYITDGVTTAWWNCFSENTIFSNMAYSDKYVRGGGNASSWHNCTLDIDNFANKENFVQAALWDGQTVIDLKGNTVPNFIIDNSETQITITNGTLGTLHVNASRCEVSMINCVANLDMTTYGLEAFSLTNCIVSGNVNATNIIVDSSHVQNNVECYEILYATDSQFDGSITGYTIGLYGCILNGIVWPRDMSGRIVAIFDRNVFMANSYIKLESDDDHTDQVKLSLTVTNNTFYSLENNGFYVQVFSTDERYLHNDATQHTWIWEGNSGNCLQTHFEAVMNIDMTAQNEKIENIRFISFGLIGYPGTLPNPISVSFREIQAQQSTGSQPVDPVEYIVTNDNQTGSFNVVKYKFNDYFAHRFHLGNGRYSGNYLITTKTIGRN